LLGKFRDEHTENWLHAYKNGVSRHPAFLDDYAFLVQALICLQEITGNRDYLLLSKQLTELIIDNFSEAGTGFFFYTHRKQQDVILRIKEIYDGATPSGNSIMAWNLHYLSLVFDNVAWRERASAICTSLNGVIVKYPTSFGRWASVTYDIFYGLNEIAVVGDRYKEVASVIAAHYLPNKVIQSAPGNDADFPLLSGRHVKHKTCIYLCRNYACLQPVEKVADFMQLIEQERKR
ncbi:MAG TPA: thioredoxin domain-containing protein, partial [Agriterribacter sp.]|nr:thioredoxin domain-containing protein [Agriterribacter sp.]